MINSWAVVVTYLCEQECVVEQLAAKSFEYFFPKIKRTVRHRGRRVHRLDPLLFNYVPVKLSEGWEQIHDMRGVQDLIGPARQSEIDRIRSSCDADSVLVSSTVHRFQFGETVSAKVGPYADLTGTYAGVNKKHQELAIFNLLGSMQTLKFSEGILVAA